MRAVSVNPIDTYIRGGANYWPLPKPFIIGCDIAGEVVTAGPDAHRFRAGDRVWGSNQGVLGRQGTFAELLAIDEQWLYPTPQSVEDSSAAACALTGITAHLGLFSRAGLTRGETILVQGGAGGVGSMVVQMARAVGARVMATCGGPEKVQAARDLGAELAVDYKRDDVAAAAESFSPGGVNVFWATCREPDFDAIVGLLAPGGRIVLMAGREARPAFPVGPFYVKGCSMYGFVMFQASAATQQAAADDINRWLAEGRLRANIGRVFPLKDAAQAHRLQEENTLRKAGSLAGKIVLTTQ
jgi:NADPH2:quinone reductase